MPSFGRRLSELRTRRRLSVRELAARSGVAHSTISLIERDRISPSVDTLAAVLDALGSTLSVFFSSSDQAPPRQPFYQARDLPEVRDGVAISYRMVGSAFPNRRILMLHERYNRTGDTSPPYSHEGEECGVVIKGRIEITVGEQVSTLSAGDAYYFDSHIPHSFRNAGEGDAEVISAMTPPSY